jgi:hypothetical protein
VRVRAGVVILKAGLDDELDRRAIGIISRSALAVIAEECRPRIAAIAGVSRSTVQRAVRVAVRLKLVAWQERRFRGQRSATNVIRRRRPENSFGIRGISKLDTLLPPLAGITDGTVILQFGRGPARRYRLSR